MKSNRSAAERTLTITGVDTREQADLAAPKFDGPVIRKASFRVRPETDPGSVDGQHETHYVFVSDPTSPICRYYGNPRWEHPEDGKSVENVCEDCRVHAGYARAVPQ